MRWKLQQQEKKLDDLFLLVQNISDEELKALMSKFLCVRTSGFIESSVKNLINEYIDGSTPKTVQQFINKKMKIVTNLRYDKLAELLGMYSDSWKSEFIQSVTDEQKASLNSIVSNRNNIAHGETDTVSFNSMKEYYRNAKEVVDVLKKIIKK